MLADILRPQIFCYAVSHFQDSGRGTSEKQLLNLNQWHIFCEVVQIWKNKKIKFTVQIAVGKTTQGGRKNDALTSINLRLKIKANSTYGHSAIKGQVLRQRWRPKQSGDRSPYYSLEITSELLFLEPPSQQKLIKFPSFCEDLAAIWEADQG